MSHNTTITNAYSKIEMFYQRFRIIQQVLHFNNIMLKCFTNKLWNIFKENT
jgi:hypothetical protein